MSDTKYEKVQPVMYASEMNLYLSKGWEIITAAFCPVDRQVSGSRAIEYVPHALMGLPVEVAERLKAESVAENVWSNGIPPQAQESASETLTEPTQPVSSAQQPIASRPTRSNPLLDQNVDLNKSSEHVVGVRRR